MPQINCYLPIKLRIVGELDDAQLEELGRTLVRTVAGRLALARETVAARHGIPLSGAEEVRESYDPGRADEESGRYLIPSYDQPGGGVSMRLKETPGHRPWIIRKSINFHAHVGPFLEFVESLDPSRALDFKVLYIDLFTALRWVYLWLVQVNRDYTLEELEGVLSARALDLNKVRDDQVLIYGMGTSEGIRRQLIELDEDHLVAKEIPDLTVKNAGRLIGSGPTSDLKEGGWALFAGMVLPRIELFDVGSTAPEVRIEVKLRELAFLVPPEIFYQRNYISWDEYVAEFGDSKEELRLQPVVVVKKVHQFALRYLMEQMVAENLRQELPKDFDADKYFGNLFVLNRTTLEKLPPSARTRAESLTDDTTRRLDDSALGEDLSPNWKAVFAYTLLSVDLESIAAARNRPMARRLVPILLAKLNGDEDEFDWQIALRAFLRDTFDDPVETRPAGGTVFEYLLAELESRGKFDLLFNKVESSGFFPLRQLLVRLCLCTKYAKHKKVQEMLRRLQERVLAGRENIYLSGLGIIWLERKESLAVKVGQALGDVYSLYIFEHKDKRLKPSRIPDFKEALTKEREALIEKILKGEDRKVYTEDEFLRTVMAAAVQRMHLTDDDFEKVTIQRSIRILKLEEKVVEALPRFFITFEFVERVKGEEWQKVSREITEIEDDFEARLIYWALGRAGEFYETMTLAITVVGLLLIGWEVGLIAALVEAAGGATAVLVSIAISELIYVIRVVFGNAELSLMGFLEAALDGYLMALGFRGASFLGRIAAKAIGTETLKATVGGWVAEKLIVGVVGGAGTAALMTFSHDLINIATGQGGWSGWRTYVRNMAIGAAVGIAVEFVGVPVFKSLGKTALEAVGDVKELVKLIKAEGIGAVRWTSLMREGLGNIRDRLSVMIGDVAARGFVEAMGERLTEVAQEMGSRFVSERVLELAQVRLSKAAGEGLEKVLTVAELNPTNALNLFNALADNPQNAAAFLELAQQLDQSAVRRVVNLFTNADSAVVQEQVKILLQSGPARESLAAFLERVWANRQQILAEGDSGAVYDLYSAALEPNPLGRSAMEYLDDIEAIRNGRPPGAVSNLQGNAMTGFHRFPRPGADLLATQERVYLNVKADHATEVMGFVVRDIVDNSGQVPGVTMAKLTGPGAIAGRADGIVIYAESDAAAQNILERVKAYRDAHPDQFLSTTPPMTNQVAGGVSVAAEPRGVRGRESFGSVRSDLIYEALDESVANNETRQMFRDRVLTFFQRRGINPEAPQVNLPPRGTP